MVLGHLILRMLGLDRFILSLWRLMVLGRFQVYLGVKKIFFSGCIILSAAWRDGEIRTTGNAEVLIANEF